MSYPNQRHITTDKPTAEGELFAMVNLESKRLAHVKLHGSCAITLWEYMASHQDGYGYDLSAIELAKWGISLSAYKKAFHKLEEEGYLTPDPKHKNGYVFHAIAHKIVKVESQPVIDFDEIVRSISGESVGYSLTAPTVYGEESYKDTSGNGADY